MLSYKHTKKIPKFLDPKKVFFICPDKNVVQKLF